MDNKIKWQINAETSVTQTMLWVIIWKLFGGWLGYLCFLMVIGNIITFFRSVAHVGRDYFKDNP